MEKIRLGIIGIGNMGSEHCRLILSGQTPEIALTCVADPRQHLRLFQRGCIADYNRTAACIQIRVHKSL